MVFRCDTNIYAYSALIRTIKNLLNLKKKVNFWNWLFHRQDSSTDELAHVEIISAIIYQLTANLSIDEIKKQGYDKYFVTHTLGIYPQGANNVPFTAAYFQSKGDPITDLTEDMAAEQKARTTYDNILALVDDEEIKKPIRFLRAREVVHYQRFAEALELVKKRLNSKNYYAFNPSFKNGKCNK